MSDAEEPLPPGADDEEEAPPGTEQTQEAAPVAEIGAGKPEGSVQPAVQPGADYSSYYGQDQSYYGQQYAYPGYYGQGYPEATAGYYPGWEGYAGQASYPQDPGYAQPDPAYAGAATSKTEQATAANGGPSAANNSAGTELPGPPPPPAEAAALAAAANAPAPPTSQPIVQVLSLSAEEREAAEKQAAEVKAAAQVASTNPEQNGKAQPEASTPEVAQGPREPSGINEQLFAQMLQAQQAAASADGNASEPASADKNAAADGKKKGPVMLKGARLAFSRPGIISGHQPHLNRASQGSQAGTETETAPLENAKSGSTDQLHRPSSTNLDRNAMSQDMDAVPAPGPKPPTPKKERYLPSFSRSPLRPRQPSPAPIPEPARPPPRDPSPDSWQASPEPDEPRRRRKHRSSKDGASGSKHKRRKHRSRAEPSMTPEPAPEERFQENPRRRRHRSSRHRSREGMQDETLHRQHSGYDDYNRQPPPQMMGPPRDRWHQEPSYGEAGPYARGPPPGNQAHPPVHAPSPPSRPLTAAQISAQLAAASKPPDPVAPPQAVHAPPQAPAPRPVLREPVQAAAPAASMPAAPAASKPVRAPALESYSSEGSDLDLPDAEALAKAKGVMGLPSGSSSDDEDDLVGRLLKRNPSGPASEPPAPPLNVSSQAVQLANAPLPSAPPAGAAVEEPMRARPRQPRTYAAHLHDDAGPSGRPPAQYQRGPPPRSQDWNGPPPRNRGNERDQGWPRQQDQYEGPPGDDQQDARERKSKKKHKKEKKRHRREHGRSRAARTGSAENEPMDMGPPESAGRRPRDDGRLGRGRYFQHDDRQGEAADGAYSDGYEGPSFFKREERQQRHRRRYPNGDGRSRSPPRRRRRLRSDSRSPSQDRRGNKRRRSSRSLSRSRSRSPSRQPDVASAAIEAAKAAAAAAAQKAITEQQMQLTRPARRVYVGALPLGTSEVELIQVFTHVMGASGGINHALGAGPVVTSCYMNMEKRFAFVEFRSIEEATNALTLDGVSFRGEQLKVRRPADYNPTAPGLLSQPQQAPILASAISAATQPTAAGHASLMPPSAMSQAPSPAPVGALGLGSPSPNVGMVSYAPSGSVVSPLQQNGAVGTHMSGVSQPPAGHPAAGSAPQASAQDPVVPEAASATKIMSHVLRLANMVTRQELADEEEYDDIVDDIREEIEDKYGTLRSVIVPKPASAGPPADPPGVGLVFVDFQDQAAAQKAQSVLNGRMFADRTVQASFFDQAAFNAQQLS